MRGSRKQVLDRRINLISWKGGRGGVQGLFVVTFLCKYNQFEFSREVRILSLSPPPLSFIDLDIHAVFKGIKEQLLYIICLTPHNKIIIQYGHEFHKFGSLSILNHPNHGGIQSALFPGNMVLSHANIFFVLTVLNKFCYNIGRFFWSNYKSALQNPPSVGKVIKELLNKGKSRRIY